MDNNRPRDEANDVARTEAAAEEAAAGPSPTSQDLTRENYDYMMDNNVPLFLDRICHHLLTERPDDMYRSVSEFLRGAAAGNFRGGVIAAGENVGGGWVRSIDSSGKIRASIDRLSFSSESGMQLVASSPKDGSILVVTNPPGTDLGVISKYSSEGRHVTDFEFPKPVSCVAVNRANAGILVGLRGGGVWVVQHNGSKLRDIQTATPLALRVEGDFLWVLTQKAVERRVLATGQLESAVHLPDTMNMPCSFAVGKKHIWVAAPNADGTANYVGAFDYMGRTMPTYVPGPGCWIRWDSHRGGVWQMPRQTSGLMQFYNERGQKVVTADIGKNKYFNCMPDEACDSLWILRVDFADETRLVQYDPLRGFTVKEVALPGVSGPVTHMVPM